MFIEEDRTQSADEPTEGWGWPFGAPLAHYFTTKGRSLCGRWSYRGPYTLTGHTPPAPNDCMDCHLQLAKLTPKQATA
jgi:hypothetical protein